MIERAVGEVFEDEGRIFTVKPWRDRFTSAQRCKLCALNNFPCAEFESFGNCVANRNDGKYVYFVEVVK